MKSADSKYISFVEATQLCFANNIKVTREIVSKTEFIIQINYNGRIKNGTERYKWDRDKNLMDEKIKQIYDTIARQILSR
jgi:hypothetical protein